MAENSKIEWCEHTFNPWVGCRKVSPACDNCYAEVWAKRTGESRLWIDELPRLTSKINWSKPYKWNRQAQECGQRQRIFCASLADVFDDRVPTGWRIDLWNMINDTPWLDWMILTKRPENMERMLPINRADHLEVWGDGYPNVWLGVTVENKNAAKTRIPILQKTSAAHRFLSCEPLLSPVLINLRGIDLVIVGGETGPKARPMNVDWARVVLLQCRQREVPFFMKQMGKKGEIPQDLMIREFPGYTNESA